MKINTKLLIIVLFFQTVIIQELTGQCLNVPNWQLQLNTVPTTGSGAFQSKFGTCNNFPINIYTNNTNIAQFTFGSNNFGSAPLGITFGDGLRIINPNPSGGPANLELWADNGQTNGTHIRFDGSGLIQGATTRFEMIGNYNGLWFNARRTSSTVASTPRIIFNIDNTNNDPVSLGGGIREISRFSNNGIPTQLGFMRVGFNPTNVDAARRLEVFDNANAPQFRITQGQNAVFTDFQTTAAGDLAIFPRNVFSTNPNRFVGIQTATPGNTLEINSQALLPSTPNNDPGGVGTGFSGLRFTDLRAASIPYLANPGTGVLSVDANGDVILVPAGTGTITGANNGATQSTINPDLIVWGQNFAQPGNPGALISNRQIPTNTYNVFFTDPVTSSVNQNRVQFGNYTGGFPYQNFAKVTAFNGENSTFPERFGGLFTTTSDFTTSLPIQFSPFYFGNISLGYKIGLVAIAQDNSNSAGRYIGVSGGAYSTVSQINIGVSGKAYGSSFENYGLSGLSGGNAPGASNYGVAGISDNGAGINYGVYGSAYGGTTNYGIYGTATNLTGTNFAGYFDGDVVRTGTDNFTSDRNLKQNIDTITNALHIVNLLKPETFYFDTTAHPNMALSSRKQWGFVAQDVETVLPELVGSAIHPAEIDSNGTILIPALTYKTLNYQGFIAILMKGIQEQQKQIDSLRTQMISCCSSTARTQNSNPTTNQTNVTLDNSQNIVLNQNVPNPFAEQTTITYNLPESVQKAQLLFYDATGKLIKAVDLDGRGNGQVNVFANDLSNGVYSYALVVDGQIADTKRMVKAK